MIKIASFVLGILSTAPFGICGDLILRIDTVGFEDVEKDVEKQEVKLLRRLETFVEPGKKFRARCRFGLEEMEVSGYAEAVHDGHIKCSVHYRYTKIPPEFSEMLQKSDQKVALPGSGFQSSITLLPGKPVTIGGTSKEERSAVGQLTSYTRTETVMALVELETEQAR